MRHVRRRAGHGEDGKMNMRPDDVPAMMVGVVLVCRRYCLASLEQSNPGVRKVEVGRA
jgi:hypothetical protein